MSSMGGGMGMSDMSSSMNTSSMSGMSSTLGSSSLGGGGMSSLDSYSGVGGGSSLSSMGAGRSSGSELMGAGSSSGMGGMSNRLSTGGSSGGVSNMFEETCTVFVRNLPFSVTWQNLRDQFKECGDVKFAELKMDEQGRSKGYSTVRFSMPEDARRAVNLMNGTRIQGRQIEVRLNKV